MNLHTGPAGPWFFSLNFWSLIWHLISVFSRDTCIFGSGSSSYLYEITYYSSRYGQTSFSLTLKYLIYNFLNSGNTKKSIYTFIIIKQFRKKRHQYLSTDLGFGSSFLYSLIQKSKSAPPFISSRKSSGRGSFSSRQKTASLSKDCYSAGCIPCWELNIPTRAARYALL